MSAEMFQQQLLEQQQVIIQLQQQFQALQQQAARQQSAPPSVTSSSITAKVAKPSTFTGHFRASVELWLFEMKTYLDIVQVPENQRVQLVGSYLKEAAALWYKYVFEESFAIGVPLTWELFQVKLLQRFRPIESSKTARVALASLRQIGSVQQYCNTFQQYVTLTSDMAEADKVFTFQRGLKAHIAREVDLREPNTLSEAMNYAIRADARNILLYRSGAPKFGQSQSQGVVRSTSMEVDNINGVMIADQDEINDTHMAVNSTYVQRPFGNRPLRSRRIDIPPSDRERCMKERRCFNCKQIGHNHSNCTKSYSKNF